MICGRSLRIIRVLFCFLEKVELLENRTSGFNWIEPVTLNESILWLMIHLLAVSVTFLDISPLLEAKTLKRFSVNLSLNFFPHHVQVLSNRYVWLFRHVSTLRAPQCRLQTRESFHNWSPIKQTGGETTWETSGDAASHPLNKTCRVNNVALSVEKETTCHFNQHLLQLMSWHSYRTTIQSTFLGLKIRNSINVLQKKDELIDFYVGKLY